MKFGFCNELFKDWEIKRMCEFLMKLGYQGVEIAPWVYFSSRSDFYKVDKVSATIEKSGLDVIGFHWIFGKDSEYYINHTDKSIREKTSDYLCELIRLCSDLKGKIIVIGSGKRRNVQVGITYKQAWEYTKDFFEKPLKVAADKGIILCLEPLSKDLTNFINTAEEAIRFIREVDHPNLALILDVYSLSKESKSMEDIILEAKDYLKHFHVDDTNKKGPGAGNVNFAPIIQALKSVNFEGYISVEVHDLKVDPEITASRSIQCLKKCFINKAK
ncbi:MAG TPA: sugar phosphate isomerase/epimerase [Candidatus Aerophobetes bacterium]|uniref:Sugar phosphate isomerase/epimerase n=1 Tax=Aerophobetes bacterium TaxID=2030807 RepID=A0A7V5LZ55_UNCAE|nr:sugar phosphate isomerase/epimerase [Candidatus Aerophobetes bacterium]